MTNEYKISNPNGLNGRAWDLTYPTAEAAAEAIRFAYQWDGIVLSDWFADDDGDSCCAYETEEQCRRDDTGAHAPWITKVAAGDENA